MYKESADFYDRLTSDVDYDKYAGYFTRIFEKHAEKTPHSVVDLGCGTGNLTVAMANKGYDMTGVDSSSDMLAMAYGKKSPGILWINQNLTGLDLFGTYNAAVSLLDCVNHLVEDGQVEQYFKRLRYFVEPSGLFVFDINTEYKFKNVYKGNVFYSVDDELSYIWQNSFDERNGICIMDMTFFYKIDNDYRRFDTVNKERAYSVEYISEALIKADFSIEAIYDDCVFEKPASDSKRIFFVCRRNA